MSRFNIFLFIYLFNSPLRRRRSQWEHCWDAAAGLPAARLPAAAAGTGAASSERSPLGTAGSAVWQGLMLGRSPQWCGGWWHLAASGAWVAGVVRPGSPMQPVSWSWTPAYTSPVKR